MPEVVFESVAERCEEATEIDLSRRHPGIAARRYRDREAPRVRASYERLPNVRYMLDEVASMYATKARPEV